MTQYFEYINLGKKKLNGRPILEWMLYNEPTDRLMLWIISNCKEAFNPKHFLQYTKSYNTQNPNDHRLKKSLEFIQSLKARGLIRQDKDLNYYITNKGQIYRIYTNTTFQFWGIVVVVLLTLFGIFKDDIFSGHNEKQEGKKYKQKTEQNAPAVQDDPSQTHHKLSLDSLLIQTDTFPKTK